jgi:hypothetical protein
MSWWLTIGLGYLAVCCIGWIIVFRKGCTDECACDRSLAPLLRQHPRAYWISMTLTMLVMGPLLPVILIHAAWQQWLACRAWQKFGRTHRAVLLEPIHPANIPQEGQDHIDRCSPILQRLDFSPQGAYLYKPEPFPIYSQYLLSREGETVVDVSLIDDMPSVSFVSVLANGHVLETGCCTAPMSEEDTEFINNSGRFTAHMIEPTEDPDFLERAYHSHLRLLADLQQRFGCGTLHLPPDQLLGLKRYENFVFGDVLFDHGKRDNRPQSFPCPAGASRLVSSPSFATSV